MNEAAAPARFGSGKSVRRVEDEALLKGAGQFADDVRDAGSAEVVFLRSPHAHARIAGIDTSAAKSMPGVIAIFTGADLVADKVKPIPSSADFRRGDGSPTAAPPRHVLAVDAVRFVGEAVTIVIAATRAQARDAAEAIDVRYDPLPAVAEAVAATQPGAPQVWPAATGNVAAEIRHGDPKAVAAAFARAAHTVSLHLLNQRVVACPIEPRALLAIIEPGSGRLILRASSQTPTGLRDTLCAEVLGIPADQVRLRVGDVGGGFGMKTGIYPEDVVVGWCARRLKRSLRWTADRLEEFLAASHGRDVDTHAELALDANGKVLALRVASLANVGAYATPAGVVIQLMIGPWVSTSIYDIALVDIGIKAVLTNTSPTGPYRGAGRPEAIYIIERLMDAAARAVGLDPAEVRRRNLIAPTAMPYTNAMKKVYDSGRFERILDGGLALADWKGFDARQAASRARGRLRGRGMASFLEWTGAEVFDEHVTVTVSGDGYIEIFSATQAMGQGLATTYAQLAVDVFGVDIDRIRILQGDTDRGTGFGSAGSRSLFVGGSAVRVAAERTVDDARTLAARALEAAASDIEYSAGRFVVGGTDRGIGLFELASRQPGARIQVEMDNKVAGETWPNGCHVCEVEIDPDTGVVEIASYASLNDVGRVVNPMIVRGQLDGGAVQGIGQALYERMAFDPESAQTLSASLMDYALPRASSVGTFRTEMDESVPTARNPLGVKGVGELGTIGATPAVVNAVVDALTRAGYGEQAAAMQMPLTPERIWRECLSRAPAR
jgi:carbon-monoxide dehydrogenase large subunit